MPSELVPITPSHLFLNKKPNQKGVFSPSHVKYVSAHQVN